MTTGENPKKPKRRAPLVRWAVVAAGVAGVAVATCRYISQMPDPKTDYVAKFEEEFGQIEGPNAAVLYWEAIRTLRIPQWDAGYSDEYNRWHAEWGSADSPSPELRRLLEKNREAIDLSARAADIPGCWLTADLLPQSTRRLHGIDPPSGPADFGLWRGAIATEFFRPLGVLAAAWGKRAWLAAEDGRLQEARRCYAISLRITRHSYRLGPEFGYGWEFRAHRLWASICYRHRRASELALPGELRELAREPSIPLYWRLAQFHLEDKIQRVYTDDGHGDGHWVPEVDPDSRVRLLRNLKGLLRPSRAVLSAEIRRLLEDQRRLVSQPASPTREWNVTQIAAQWEARMQSRDRTVWVLDQAGSWALPGSWIVHVHPLAQSARVGVVRVWQVLEFLRVKGRLPKTLDELPGVAQYEHPNVATRALIYQTRKGRFAIYTTGRNGVDNGGPAHAPVVTRPGRWMGPVSDDRPVWPPFLEAWKDWQPADSDGKDGQ